MAVNYFSVFLSIVVLTIISQRGKLVDSIIYSADFIDEPKAQVEISRIEMI